MGQNCPVLNELAVTEDYDREHEQAPVLSGGDYDISAIRDCGESCLIGALARQRKLQIEGLEEAVEGLTLENRRLREALEALIGDDGVERDWLAWSTKAAAARSLLAELGG